MGSEGSVITTEEGNDQEDDDSSENSYKLEMTVDKTKRTIT